MPQGPPPGAATLVGIVLPSTLYLVVGQTYRLELAKMMSGFDGATQHAVIELSGAEPVTRRDFWEYTPTAAGSFTLTITVRDETGRGLGSATRPVIVSALHTGHNLRHLSIGDSITRAGVYADQAVRCILGGRTVGTRTYDAGTICTEGRGGWTLEQFVDRIGHPTGGDSPFVYPSGIQGAKYLGNTAFWREVTTTDAEGYDYEGFQMAARGWHSEGTYTVGPDGYPTSATDGDVVVDPTLPAGKQWRQFNGSTWVQMQPQPRVGMSFKKYMDRYADAFTDGPPTSISIMLGTVDLVSSPAMTVWPAYKARMDLLISSIRQWDSHVPIIVIAPPSGAPAPMWADQKITSAEYNHRVMEFARLLYSAYDTDRARVDGIWTMSFLGVVADDNMTDYVHPKIPAGHDQMGPWLAGILANLIAKNEI